MRVKSIAALFALVAGALLGTVSVADETSGGKRPLLQIVDETSGGKRPLLADETSGGKRPLIVTA